MKIRKYLKSIFHVIHYGRKARPKPQTDKTRGKHTLDGHINNKKCFGCIALGL